MSEESGLDHSESPVIFTVYYSMNTISLLGQLFIIITYLSIRRKSNSFYKYVAYHAVLELPWLITNFFIVAYREEKSPSCEISASVNIYSYLAGMFWSSIIAWVIFRSLQTQQKLYSFKWYYHGLTYGLSVAFIIRAILIQDIGPFQGSGISYCWIENNLSGSIFITYWIPLILTTLFNLFCYIRSALLVKKFASKEAGKEFWSLLLFPLIAILCNSGGAIRRISLMVGGSYSEHLEILHIVCAKGQGLLEALAYGLNVGVRKEIYKVWCQRRKRDQSSSEDINKSLNGSIGFFKQDSLQSEYTQRSGRLVL